MLEPATPPDVPLLLSPLSSLPDRTAAVDYGEQEACVTDAMPVDLREWEDERIALYNLERYAPCCKRAFAWMRETHRLVRCRVGGSRARNSTTRQMTGVLRVQKDLLKDSQRQLQDTRQVAEGVDEQPRAATRERDALLSSRRSRGARTGPMRGRASMRARGGRRPKR